MDKKGGQWESFATRLQRYFGSESNAKKLEKKYKKDKITGKELYELIPEENRDVKQKSFLTKISEVWTKTTWGGKRPNSGQKKKKE